MTPRLRALSLAAPAAVLLVVSTALPASAAVTVSGPSVFSDGAADFIQVSCSGGNLASTGTVATGDPCATLTSISVDAGGGADTIDLSSLTAASFPALATVNVNLGEGVAEDTATGSPVNDNFTGDEGNYGTANGGVGNDSFNGVASAIGGPGDDVFVKAYRFAAGGPGDDRFVQFTAQNGMEGGDGFDTWEADFDQNGIGLLPPDVTFTPNGSALVVAVPDLGVSQSILISGMERWEVTLLRESSETWQGADLVASQEVRGLTGNDTLVGGPADDELVGGLGNDTITGGPGADLLIGNEGDDTVQARDGVADRIDCGGGNDTVVADAVDVVVGCENVDQPALPTPPTPATPAPVVVTVPGPVQVVPVVPVTGAVSGPAKVKKGKSGSFAFSSTTAGATFQCQVDAGAWKTCASPYKVSAKKLKVGKHKLSVRALVSGAADATPSVKTFKVV